MTFKQLFDHIGQFVNNREQRWKHVMRVKRGLVDPNDLGGYGKDQCYFEGAVNILRNIDNIDFALLMSGKLCYDEVNRVKRLARMNCIRLPSFMRDMTAYRLQLKQMALVNGLDLAHPCYGPSPAYLRRLEQRQAGLRRRARKGRDQAATLDSLDCARGTEPLEQAVKELHKGVEEYLQWKEDVRLGIFRMQLDKKYSNTKIDKKRQRKVKKADQLINQFEA
nr:hypothetical protein BaRGS_006468 [Batillaria attramentaria]